MRLSELEEYEFEAFYGTYLTTLDNTSEVLDELQNGKKALLALMDTLSPKALQHQYKEGKWTVAEVIVHIMDTERVFTHRALRFSRGDNTPLPGFEQDGYVLECNASDRTIDQLKTEFVAVREASITLFAHMTKEQLKYTGDVGDLKWSVAGIGFTISGHQKHHVNILKERYL
ncbi:MAG: damage-inducible protein DinB [Flavobacteriaceae bacterium]|nr:MAG: damage-inducible protein DinB [Flavobacteriaceae bacterium]